MGMLLDGEWKDMWVDTKKFHGHFKRESSQFRNWITADGSAGETGTDGFLAEEGRYHLYVGLACPWAHRTIIFRQLKGLEDYIDVSIVDPLMLENGWEFRNNGGGTNDPINHAKFLWQIYKSADSDYTGRVTVPVVWDKKRETIVSNESSEIIRMFNNAFDHLTGNNIDFYPQDLREKIDEINAIIYKNINNGVYKSGFATSQSAYLEHVTALFKNLDMLDEHLSEKRFLLGERITEADWRLFTTLVRFDAVYVGHFKCNLKRIVDYPNLSDYLRELYQIPGIKETVNFDHIKRHYYCSHRTINPTGIVPSGPILDLDVPHGRGRIFKL